MEAPLLIDQAVQGKLKALRSFAEANPLDIKAIAQAMEDKESIAVHRDRMNRQTIKIPGPWAYYVTYSVETGHRIGTCRHMSMSVDREGRVPSPVAAWMVAADLGFHGMICSCEAIWFE